jgi:hypothetical protein
MSPVRSFDGTARRCRGGVPSNKRVERARLTVQVLRRAAHARRSASLWQAR